MDIEIHGADPDDIPAPDSTDTLEDYLESLNDKFADMNRVVNPESVNGDPFDPEHTSWTPDRIDHLELSVQPIEQLVVETLVDLAGYLDRALENLPDIIEGLRAGDTSDVDTHRRQLVEAYSVINQMLTSMVGIVHLEDRSKQIKKLNQRVKDLSQQIKEADADSMVPVLEDTEELFNNLRTEIENIVSILNQREQILWEGTEELEDMLAEDIETIPGIVEGLQSNPEPETYDQIDQLVGDIERVLNFVKDLDDAGKIKLLMEPEQQEELSEAHMDLDRGIDELNKAFEDQDVIMICDILEYEILPYLEEIQEFVSDINDMTDAE